MSDAQFMRLALRFARRGYGATSRNPNAVASPFRAQRFNAFRVEVVL